MSAMSKQEMKFLFNKLRTEIIQALQSNTKTQKEIHNRCKSIPTMKIHTVEAVEMIKENERAMISFATLKPHDNE